MQVHLDFKNGVKKNPTVFISLMKLRHGRTNSVCALIDNLDMGQHNELNELKPAANPFLTDLAIYLPTTFQMQMGYPKWFKLGGDQSLVGYQKDQYWD